MMRQNIPNLSYFRLVHKSASCSQLQGRYARACDLCTNPSIRVLLREACTWSSKFSGTINYTNITRDPGSRDPNTHACMHHAGSAGSRGIPESCMHAHAADSLIFLILPKMTVLASLFALESIWVPDLWPGILGHTLLDMGNRFWALVWLWGQIRLGHVGRFFTRSKFIF